jgi:uncharacterized Zn-finger protein
MSKLDYLLCRYVMVTVDNSGSTRFACIKCNKNFAQKSYIKEHMKIHTGTINLWEKEQNRFHSI